VDEEDPEIRVARHNVIMQTTGGAAAPRLQAQLQDRGVLINTLSSIYNDKRGTSQAPFSYLIKDQVLLEFTGR